MQPSHCAYLDFLAVQCLQAGHSVPLVQGVQSRRLDQLVLVDPKHQAALVLQLILVVLGVRMVLDLRLVQSVLEAQGVLLVHDCHLVH